MSEEHLQDSRSVKMEEGDVNGGNSDVSESTCECIMYSCLGVIVLPFILLYLVVFLPFVTFLLPTLALPLLFIALLVVRLLQFVRSGDGFDKVIQFKYIILSWIFLATLDILFFMGIFFPIAKQASSLKHVRVLGLPLTKWVSITCMICGFYSLSYCVSLFMHVVLHQILYLIFKRIINSMNSIYVREAVSEIINCLIFWRADSELVKHVPTFNQHQVLGLQTHSWIKAATFALIGYDCITLCKHALVWLLGVGLQTLDRSDNPPTWYSLFEKLLHKKHMVYCAKGLRRSICFIFSSVLLLLIWVLYFGSHLKKTVRAKHVLGLGTWNFVSLLICSLLWLIKNCVLLAWEANAIYNRLYSKISENGKQLYFLGLLGRQKYDIFNLLYFNEEQENSRMVGKSQKHGLMAGFLHVAVKLTGSHNKHQSEDDKEDHWGEKTKEKKVRLLSTRKRRIVENDLLLPKGWTPSLHDIQRIAQHLLTAKDALSADKYASDILQYLKTNNPSGDSNGVKVAHLKQLISREEKRNDAAQDSSGRPSSGEDEKNGDQEKLNDAAQGSSDQPSSKETEQSEWKAFQEMLEISDVDLSEENIAFEKIQTWVEKAHKSCLFLANTVISGKEVVDCLNTIISGALIFAAFIMCLLFTGIASTKVLVLIASPLLAASFIFGETCKNLFQGIIFIYVVHPFDVGDTCDIGEDKELLVKAIGVWKTTFSKPNSATEEGKTTSKPNSTVEVIYPNVALAKQKVTNHKIKFDWLVKHDNIDIGALIGKGVASMRRADLGGSAMTAIVEHIPSWAKNLF